MTPHAPLEASLDDLAILEVSGADAATFLQGQLTQDISSPQPGRAQLAGYCSPKGRLMASMIVWQETNPPGTFFILLKQDILADFATRLTRYVMRAKVSIKPFPARITGVTFPETDDALESLTANGFDIRQLVTHDDGPADSLPASPSGVFQPYDITYPDQETWIAAPAGHPGLRRWWRITAALPVATPAPAGFVPVPAACWQAQDIAAGLGWVESATREAFIPQTLNLDLIGGLSFTKGCYPGQEVVARSHYRGTIKRRMVRGAIRATADTRAAALPGADIFAGSPPDAPPCGRVINAAQAGESIAILFEAALADLASPDFRFGSAGGPAIALEPLPYDISAATA